MPEAVSARAERTLEQVLVELQLLGEEPLAEAKREASLREVALADYLIDERLLSPEDLATARSLLLNLPVVDFRRHVVQPAALELVPEEYAREHDLIPIDIVADALVVVMADPGDLRALEDLRALARMAIQPAVGVPSDIRAAIGRSYRASEEIEEQVGQLPSRHDALAPAEGPTPASVAETPIVRTVQLLLTQAVRDRASDIHFEPQEHRLRVRYRIDGLLHEIEALPMGVHAQLVTRVKVLAGMNIAERRRPQDGQFSLEVDGRMVDFRVATTDAAHGELMVLRVLDKSLSLVPLGDLGLLPEQQERFEAMLEAPFGMILVGGPTGSGKTTTLYASVNTLDRETRNVVTIEDPVEYLFPDVNQIPVNARASLTFASGLRSVMRLDPDVILLGEVRDGETAEMVTQAALTGHLVLSSIHANDAVSVLFRLRDLGADEFALTAALVGVVSQRMVRRVCPRCASPTEVPAAARLAYEQELGEVRETFDVGSGCNFCAGTGYLGRIGVFEVLALDDELRRMLLAQAGAAELRAHAVEAGMIAMRRAGMLQARAGTTSPTEVLRAIFSVH